MAIDLDKKGFASLEVIKTIKLKDTGGQPYSGGAVDPEEIRRLPNGNLIWSDEGTTVGGGPALTEITRDGRAVDKFTLPAYYKPTTDKKAGVRRTLATKPLLFHPMAAAYLPFSKTRSYRMGP